MGRLVLGLPTALQLDSGSPLLFHEGGVCRLLCPDRTLGSATSNFTPPERIRALIDSNKFTAAPARVSRSKVFFVVETFAFSLARFQWMDEPNSRRFFMKTWSFSEVPLAYMKPPPVRVMMLAFYAAARTSGTLAPTRSTRCGSYTTSTEHPPGCWPVLSWRILSQFHVPVISPYS